MAAKTDRTESSGADDRASFFDGSDGYSEYLSTEVGDARLFVKTEDKHVGRALFIKKGRGDIKVLARCVMTVRALFGARAISGRTFVDVGANIGTTTVSALVFHPFARALALEPEPENFRTLRLNLVLNDVEDRATALQTAVSNAVGALDLVVNRSRSGRHWITTDARKVKASKDGATLVKVPTVTLDSLVETGVLDPSDVGLLWLDAENHEGSILEGAAELMRRGVPTVFEWDPKGLEWRGDAGKIDEIVREHYTHFTDMRGPADPGQPRFQLHPVEELARYTHPVGPDGEHHFTEILVLRLTDKQVARAGAAIKSEKARGGPGATTVNHTTAPTKPQTGKELLEQLKRAAERERAADRAERKREQSRRRGERIQAEAELDRLGQQKGSRPA